MNDNLLTVSVKGRNYEGNAYSLTYEVFVYPDDDPRKNFAYSIMGSPHSHYSRTLYGCLKCVFDEIVGYVADGYVDEMSVNAKGAEIAKAVKDAEAKGEKGWAK